MEREKSEQLEIKEYTRSDDGRWVLTAHKREVQKEQEHLESKPKKMTNKKKGAIALFVLVVFFTILAVFSAVTYNLSGYSACIYLICFTLPGAILLSIFSGVDNRRKKNSQNQEDKSHEITQTIPKASEQKEQPPSLQTNITVSKEPAPEDKKGVVIALLDRMDDDQLEKIRSYALFLTRKR